MPERDTSETARDYDSLYKSYVTLLSEVDRLSTLRDIAHAVSSTIEMDEVLPLIATVVQSALDVSKVTLFRLDKGGLTSKPVVAKYGNDLISEDRLAEETTPVRGAPMGEALEARQPLIDTTQYASSVLVPLIARGSPLGILRLDNRLDGKAFESEEAPLLQAVGSLVALAVNNAQLYSEAVTDSLTGLYVRRYFEIRMAEEVDQAQRYNRVFSLLMLDLDNFQKINDTYGRQSGDLVLEKCARILKDNTRKSDVCCRYEGEKLAVILPENDIEAAAVLAGKLRDHIATLPFIGSSDQVIKLTASVGVAQYREETESARRLVKATDEALYNAKANGGNRVERAGQ